MLHTRLIIIKLVNFLKILHLSLQIPLHPIGMDIHTIARISIKMCFYKNVFSLGSSSYFGRQCGAAAPHGRRGGEGRPPRQGGAGRAPRPKHTNACCFGFLACVKNMFLQKCIFLRLFVLFWEAVRGGRPAQ